MPGTVLAKTTTLPTSATYGTVRSVTKSALSVVVGKKLYVVSVSSKTVYQNEKSKLRTLSEVRVNDRIWVWGQKNVTKLTIMNVSKVKDMSVIK